MLVHGRPLSTRQAEEGIGAPFSELLYYPPTRLALYTACDAARTGTVCQQPCRRGFPEAYSILGDSLIAAVPTNPTTTTQTNSYGGTSTTAFYTLAHVLSGDTQVTPLGSFTSEGRPGYTVADDTLYVSVLAGEVTDQSGVVVLDNGWTNFYAIGQITSGVSTADARDI